ncbi:hypothetical protein [Legionella spiritensis]|uniref:Uncharacterized protein n=1 Tax=Legionella spiritensis TaxID=452 RepID=A0A0W0Z328_LEGSP|nr:hypothetical protein [Legionella spiritensis]KTD63158.1 hypothetical protein Lspi_1706 [Legionella spiritensis]SNV45368.1 Uncharacterised protein [Legionella spiritensis]
MNKVLIVLPLLVSISNLSYSNTDNCQRLPGNWNGFALLTDEPLCRLYGGCKFKISAHITRISETQFEVNYRPGKGQGKIIAIDCREDRISNPSNPDSKFNFWCIADNCSIEYSDPKQIVYAQNF